MMATKAVTAIESVSYKPVLYMYLVLLYPLKYQHYLLFVGTISCFIDYNNEKWKMQYDSGLVGP